MSGQQWRKALWHFRNGGIDGLCEFRRRTRQDSATSIPAGEAAATTVLAMRRRRLLVN